MGGTGGMQGISPNFNIFCHHRRYCAARLATVLTVG